MGTSDGWVPRTSELATSSDGVSAASSPDTAPARPPDPYVGRTVGGCVVERLVGRGGMGSVYVAEQRSLERSVAIKFLRPDLLRDEISTRRFYNEARTASRLSHPNSVSVFDFGATDDGVPFIVMEYLDGADLGSVRKLGPIDPAAVCRIACAVLGALGEAHALGICHRDLKPENIIVKAKGDGTELVKVVDFGLARLNLDVRLTDPHVVLGTPYYMAPEQFIGEEVDGRADLYALGVVMYEMLTGRPPFEAENALALAHKHLTVPVPDPRERGPVDDALAAVVMKALEKKPEDRFPSALAMGQALMTAAAGLQGGDAIPWPLPRAAGAPASSDFAKDSARGAEPQTSRAAGSPAYAAVQVPTLASPRGSVPEPRLAPSVPEVVPAPAPDSAVRPTPPSRGVVVVVEDDVELQETLWACLTEEGYDVKTASSGKQALRLLATIEPPLAILVDLMMPVMNGWEFVAALRAEPRLVEVPVTVLSAVSGKAPERVTRLQKPVRLDDLLAILERAAGHPAAEA